MRTNYQTFLFGGLLLLVFFFGGCSGKQEMSTPNEVAAAAPASDAAAPEVAQNEAAPAKQMLIKDAQVKFQVKDLAHSTQRIENAVKKHNAILANTSQQQAQDEQVMNFEIRVKPEQFTTLLEELEKESVKLEYRNLASEDVAVEYVDVQARLKAKRAVEQRYLALLNQAKNINDILEVEQYLLKVREEIESADARLHYLQNQTAYSTIKLEIYQLVPLSFTERIGLGTRFYNALGTGWQMFLSLLVGLCYLWPLLLFGLGFYLLRRRRLI
ncbi:DUF4349 domain-containing protein [Rufibacter immobilis]|uniref:DUF4349 domain-containing protein n=1 Tax=Rufibacter immobilis TaxID=1348778 RepID=UPI0035EDA029